MSAGCLNCYLLWLSGAREGCSGRRGGMQHLGLRLSATGVTRFPGKWVASLRGEFATCGSNEFEDGWAQRSGDRGCFGSGHCIPLPQEAGHLLGFLTEARKYCHARRRTRQTRVRWLRSGPGRPAYRLGRAVTRSPQSRRTAVGCAHGSTTMRCRGGFDYHVMNRSAGGVDNE